MSHAQASHQCHENHEACHWGSHQASEDQAHEGPHHYEDHAHEDHAHEGPEDHEDHEDHAHEGPQKDHEESQGQGCPTNEYPMEWEDLLLQLPLWELDLRAEEPVVCQMHHVWSPMVNLIPDQRHLPARDPGLT